MGEKIINSHDFEIEKYKFHLSWYIISILIKH